MAKYKVIKDFRDLQDGGRLYEEGESFPKPANKKISKERIKELSTKGNAQKTAFIKEVKEQE